MPEALSILSAFVVKPRDVRFQNQEEKETVVLLLRQHWITNLRWLVITFLLILAPFFLWPLFAETISDLSGGYKLIVFLGWYLCAFSYTFVNFIIWYFNVYLVTTERIVDVDFHNLLYKNVATTRIAKIQEVRSQNIGALSQIFNYGTVFISTAADTTNIEFENIPRPAKVVKIIEELMEKEELQWEEKPNGH